MLENHRQKFRIISAGPIVLRTLYASPRGRVEAVFERSFYASLGGQLICILPRQGGLGPLNARCDEAGLENSIKRFVRVGDKAAVTGTTLSIGDHISFAFSDAVGWHPPILSHCNEESVTRGMSALRRHLGVRSLPSNGLAFLIAGEGQEVTPNPDLAAAAKEPVERLAFALASAMGAGEMSGIESSKLMPLLGLGPGLTPSGDDVIGGVMIALCLLGQARIRDVMWSQIRPVLPEVTNRISIAHLEAAAGGYGHAAIHDLVNAIFSGQIGNLDRQLDVVDAIGHTSGWDALVGVVVAAMAWLRVHGRAHERDIFGLASPLGVAPMQSPNP
ncbi:MAG: DUF2877 domain-containing protein [Xanthobacteraceae bacterium]|nr:DUF2877 domain-containing protein [Xanthobacteraceae bacterium]